jgi:hypothetical protein
MIIALDRSQSMHYAMEYVCEATLGIIKKLFDRGNKKGTLMTYNYEVKSVTFLPSKNNSMEGYVFHKGKPRERDTYLLKVTEKGDLFEGLLKPQKGESMNVHKNTLHLGQLCPFFFKLFCPILNLQRCNIGLRNNMSIEEWIFLFPHPQTEKYVLPLKVKGKSLIFDPKKLLPTQSNKNARDM